MSELENLAILPKERKEAILTIEAMQHPNQLGMYADWWIKWLRRSVALDTIYTSSSPSDEDLRKIVEDTASSLKEHCGFGDFGCSKCLEIILQALKKAREI